MNLQPGNIAPLFTLFDSDKQKVSLEEQLGKTVVLLFFPLAFTSTCTKELCSVRDNISAYNNSNALVFGISVDSLYSLARFKEDQNLNFQLLSDFNKTVSTDCGTIYPEFGFEMKGVSKRSAFVIDKDGIIRYAEVLDNASQVPDFVKIEQTIQELKHKVERSL